MKKAGKRDRDWLVHEWLVYARTFQRRFLKLPASSFHSIQHAAHTASLFRVSRR
jgi:hypothetical protein